MKTTLHLPSTWNMCSYQRAERSRAITLQSAIRVAAGILIALKRAIVGTSPTSGATTTASKVEQTPVVPASHAKRLTKDRISAPKTTRSMQRFHDRTAVMRQIYM